MENLNASLTAENVIDYHHKLESSQKIKFKRDQINPVLLAYLRIILFKSFFKTESSSTLPLSEVTHIEFEIEVISFYLTML